MRKSTYMSIPYQTIPKADTAHNQIYTVLNAKLTKKIREILSVLSKVQWKYTRGIKNIAHNIKYPPGNIILENKSVRSTDIGLGIKYTKTTNIAAIIGYL